jgi:hypothetical protein
MFGRYVHHLLKLQLLLAFGILSILYAVNGNGQTGGTVSLPPPVRLIPDLTETDTLRTWSTPKNWLVRNTSTKRTFFGIPGDLLTVGDGIYTPTGEPGPKCVEYKFDDANELTSTIPNPGQNVSFTVKKIDTIEELKQSLNVSAAASFGWGVFSGDAQFSFAKSGSYNSYSSYLFVRMTVQNATRLLKDRRMSAAGMTMIAAGWPVFLNRCGDQFVNGYRTGGEFAAIVRAESHSASEYSNTQAAVQASVNAILASADGQAEFKNQLETLNKSSKLEVIMIRKGSLGDIPGVGALIDAVQTFPCKVKDGDPCPGKPEGNPWVYELITQRYGSVNDFPPDFGSMNGVASQISALETISSWLDKAYKIRSDLNYISLHPEEFQDPKLDLVAKLFDENENRISTFDGLKDRCGQDAVSGCQLPSPPVFPNIQENWVGKGPKCSIWEITDENGNQYSETFEARGGNWLGYFDAGSGRPGATFSPPPAGIFSWPLLQTNEHVLKDSRGSIYRVNRSCNGNGCGWSYDPGDHPASPYGLRHQPRYDINGNRFRWYRKAERRDIDERYTAYYAVPVAASGAVCNSPAATNPGRSCRWYPQPEACH